MDINNTQRYNSGKSKTSRELNEKDINSKRIDNEYMGKLKTVKSGKLTNFRRIDTINGVPSREVKNDRFGFTGHRDSYRGMTNSHINIGTGNFGLGNVSVSNKFRNFGINEREVPEVLIRDRNKYTFDILTKKVLDKKRPYGINGDQEALGNPSISRNI